MDGLFYFLGVVVLVTFLVLYIRTERKKRLEYELRDISKTVALMDISKILNQVFDD